MPKFTLSVPKPCHENWDTFTSTQNGAFCKSCQKEVIDFTNWTESEIKVYFRSKATATCGRFKPSQLKAYAADEKRWYSKWMAMLTFLLVIALKNSHAQVIGKTEITTQREKRQIEPFAELIDAPWILTGKVINDNKEALPGVNVVQQNSVNGTVTDIEGRFKLTIDKPKASEVISFSFIGMVTIDSVVFKSENDLIIVMETDLTALSQAVVVGGVCAKRSFFARVWWKATRIFKR